MSKKMIDWSKIDEGTHIVAKYKGNVTYGIFIALCGGKDKGKLRVNLDGDTAQYREVKQADVDLAADVTEEKVLSLVPMGDSLHMFESVMNAMREGKQIEHGDGTVIRFDGEQVLRRNGDMWVQFDIPIIDIFSHDNWRIL